MNKVLLIGNLGQDPETKTFGSGANVCNFSLATNKKFKDKNTGETKQTTTWHQCQAWNKTADLCSTYLKKGSKVFVEGEINISHYETDQGEKRSMHRIIVFGVQFLDPKEEGSTTKKKPKTKEKQQKMPAVDNVETNHNYTEDDIPF